MKRDMDLARQILLMVEDFPFDGQPRRLQIDGQTPEELSYHVMLLHEQGFLEAADLSTMETMEWRPIRLTYDGHEFLDAARDDARWEKAKDTVRKSAGTLTFDALRAVLTSLIQGAVKVALSHGI